MGKKKLTVVLAMALALFLAVVLILSAVIGSNSDKNTTTTTSTASTSVEESTTSLYGDVDPEEEDNIDIIDKASTMRKKVCAQVKSLQEDGYGKVAYKVKKTKLNEETVYQLYAGKEATQVYLSFDEQGPTATCTGTTDADTAAMRAAVTSILYVCTPSIGNLNACAKVFDTMKGSMADNQTVTYNQNYTEYHYSVDGTTATFDAMETQVVG